MVMQRLNEILSEVMMDFPQISLVYLFGSQVTGQIGPMSDYDLAILVDASSDDEYAILAKFRHTLVKLLDTGQIDVISLNHTPIELAYHIISSGELLYHKDAYTRVEFESLVLGKYGDYLPYLRLYRDHILHGDSYAKRVQRYRESLRRTQRAFSSTRALTREKTR